jgi:hypothetical protein
MYLYVHTFTHENSYDLDRGGGGKNEIVKCLCPQADVVMLKIHYIKQPYSKLLIAVAGTNVLKGQTGSTVLAGRFSVKVKPGFVCDIIIIIIIIIL